MSVSKKKSAVKLKDVASDAEVSITTVSLALRNHPSIPETTRRRILEAKKRLGYVPIRRRTQSVHLHPSDNAGPRIKNILFCVVNLPVRKIEYADFFEGVMRACQERNIRLEVQSIQKSDSLPGSQSTAGPDCSNILTGDLDLATVDRFVKLNPKTIILGNYHFPHVHSVELDVFGMGETVAERLVSDGHRNVVHLQRHPKNYYERQFLMGLLDGLAAHKNPPPQLLQVPDLFESVTGAAGQILKMRPQVTATTSAIPNVSEACLTEMRCQETGKSRPTPVFYTTSMIFGERSAPSLQIIDAGLQRCGWLAVDRLCQMHAHAAPFPFASIVPAAGWREIGEG